MALDGGTFKGAFEFAKDINDQKRNLLAGVFKPLQITHDNGLPNAGKRLL